MKKFLFLLAVMLTPLSIQAIPVEEAQQQGDKWLSYIDKKASQASWFATSPLFQQSISLEKWQASLETNRYPFGNVIARRLFKATERSELPGAPEGNYMVLQYRTQFEFKTSSVETVTLVQSNESQWQTIGYFIN
jgi:hypothetical protein